MWPDLWAMEATVTMRAGEAGVAAARMAGKRRAVRAKWPRTLVANWARIRRE